MNQHDQLIIFFRQITRRIFPLHFVLIIEDKKNMHRVKIEIRKDDEHLRKKKKEYTISLRKCKKKLNDHDGCLFILALID